jgi:Domain of unknown function (DUF4157)
MGAVAARAPKQTEQTVEAAAWRTSSPGSLRSALALRPSQVPLVPASAVRAPDLDGDPADVESQSGRPLEVRDRAAMKAFFGRDFGAVRIHADAAAAASARSHLASAYTSGTHVVFGEGRYAPRSVAGRRLLAHELAHVVQQHRGLSGSQLSLEREAQTAERGELPPVAAHASSRQREVRPTASSVQCQDDPAAVRARLQEVRRRLATLRARYQRLSDDFAGSRTRGVTRRPVSCGAAALPRAGSAKRCLWR